MIIRPQDIQRALDKVDRLVRRQHYYTDFLRHRDRYASDATIVCREFDLAGPLIEIGSFPGHFTTLLSILQVPCVGVDLDPGRLEKIGSQVKLDVRRADIEREHLPFGSGSISNIIFSEVFEHLRVDPVFTLSELNRVLVPNGKLLLTTPNLYSVQQIVRFICGRGIGDPLTEFMKLRTIGHMGHVREYSHREMCRFLAATGFEVQEVWFKHYFYGGGKRGLVKKIVFSMLPARFRTFQVLLVRKKQDINYLQPLTGG